LRFHGSSVLHFKGRFKCAVDEFGQARAGSVPLLRPEGETGRARVLSRGFFRRRERSWRWPRPK
jgi:hypothetical protein